MVTSFSVAKKDESDVEYLKDWCKDRGISKSFIIMELISAWVYEQEKKAKCTASIH